jgi:hypothetical protein
MRSLCFVVRLFWIKREREREREREFGLAEDIAMRNRRIEVDLNNKK